MKKVQLIESPRDAVQGIKTFIPTEKKVEYLRSLLDVGFDIIDCGSLVSSKAIPQLADTAELLMQIGHQKTKSKLMVLIGNERGAESALLYDQIDYLGYPFSVSETFLQKNINKSLDQAETSVLHIYEQCNIKNKDLILYITMAFGNPYGDDWSAQKVIDWVGKFKESGIRFFDLTDILGLSEISIIASLFSKLTASFPECKFGFHLHTNQKDWYAKIEAAFLNGCQVFDAVLSGAGGCPMTGYELLGNIDTINILKFLKDHDASPDINSEALMNAHKLAIKLFNSYF